MGSKLVLSASQLGEECLRKLWFLSRGYEVEVSEELQRVFDIGRALEPVVVKWLRRMGYEVFYNAKDHSDEPDFRIPVGDLGEIWGRFDAVLMNEGVLIDIKTCGDQLFVRFLERDVPMQYIVQVNVYFFGVKLFGEVVDDEVRRVIKEVGLVGVHKSTGRMEMVVMKPSLDVFGNALVKARRVFKMKSPFEVEESKQHCLSCAFRSVCR